MVVKIYVSNVSGNKETRKNQQILKQVLETKKITFEEIDISDPTCEEQRQFMWDHAKCKGSQPKPLAPQVFNDDDYLGDYDEFIESNECDELFEFLKLAPATSKSEAEITLSEKSEENGGDDQ